jgi:hypothetical protein
MPNGFETRPHPEPSPCKEPVSYLAEGH